MKQRFKAVSFALVLALLLSVVVTGAPILGPFEADVVSAATSGATPAAPAPAPAPKPAPAPAPKAPAPKAPVAKAPVAAPAVVEFGSRLLVEGSFGSDVVALQEKLNENGFNLKVDGFFGPKTLAALKSFQSNNGLRVDGIFGPKTNAKLNVVAVAIEPSVLKIGRADFAAHGTKSFASTAVAMVGNKIIGASLEEYQYMAKDTSVGVPNSDVDFGTYFKEGYVLGSKLTNVDSYSANMATRGGSTVAIDKNFQAIEAYVTGKTVAELEAVLAANTPEQMVDAVSSATLVDTHGYIASIVAAAKASKATSVIVDDATAANIEMKRADFAAHGTKSFASTVVVMSGNKVLGASLEEYQYMAKDTSVGVPNSDADFGTYAKEGYVLGSKLTNAATYSKNMAERGGSTVAVDKNFQAIEAYVTGKTVAELEAVLAANTPEQMVDAVSSATLVDTHGYISSIVAAAKAGIVEVDAVSGPTESVAKDEASLVKGFSEKGAWIIVFEGNLTTNKDLVLEGEFVHKDVVDRKIALYTQDDKRVVLERFTLTAPKLVVKSPNARIQNGTFKGDIHVYAPNFKLQGSVVDGDIYFVTQEAKDTFVMDDKSSVTGNKILADIDVVATASLVHDGDAFVKALAEDGKWIICPLRDLVIDQDLVLEGVFHDKNDPEKDLKRKIGLYTHNDPDDKKKATHKFTLTAPSLTIKSPSATLQYGTFVGDVYVEAENFSLVNNELIGNLYFTNQAAMDTFVNTNSTISGVQELKTN